MTATNNPGPEFGIDAGTGVITVIGTIDYEGTKVYELSVEVCKKI